MRNKSAVLTAIVSLYLLAACSDHARFTQLPVAQSGVAFENTLTEHPDFNFINYLYFYNGGGVAAGDVNNDGFEDLFFTSNQEGNKLYLNNGDFSFADVTESAGIEHQPESWSTGVSMADINGDGWLDIYVSNVNYLSRKGKNQLYINKGNGTFEEKAEEFGLDFEGYSVQAAFFDYDKDGDLDMYLLNHSVHSIYSYRPIDSRERVDPKSGDRLFRNDDGQFTDVSTQAGIYSSALGFGLGVTVSDINKDGWPDIYVGNDFHEDDYLYINQKDGTFSELMREALRHTSQFTMSVDIADINNDGKPEIAATDMLPYEENILKRSGGGDTYQVAKIKKEFGYYPQFSRNMLQLNVGETEEGIPVFSDIGYLAGVEATDWSWSALLTDLDNDGNRDFFVSNGIFRRPNDLDYIKFLSSRDVQASLQQGINPENLKLVQRMPQLKIPNAAFQNNGDYTFTDRSNEWGLGAESYSNGTTFADFDNDGDIDLAVNNVNQPAFIYRNETVEQGLGGGFIQLSLHGDNGNTYGFGTKVEVFENGKTHYAEQYPVRGFQSSVSPIIHIGVGEVDMIDSVRIIWPDDRMQILTKIAPNSRLDVYQIEADVWFNYSKKKESQPFFKDITADMKVDFRHQENAFIDFDNELLIPHSKSTSGPPLTVADVNMDGLEDFYVGNASQVAGELWIQEKNGGFIRKSQKSFQEDRFYEDTDALFFDANGDSYPDLVVASAGGEVEGEVPQLVDRLYINDGSGNFQRSVGLPPMFTNSSVISAGDFDGDGDEDLFIGGASVPYLYGEAPRSFLLQNDGKGKFTDVTETISPQLQHVGMVSDASWSDLDEDDDLDLVIVGEWMPITVFKNNMNSPSAEGSVFEEVTSAIGFAQTNGWWNTLEITDLNGDGLPDILAGNLGMNSYFRASNESPVSLYLSDYNGDGKGDPVLTHYVHGKVFPYASIDELFSQMTVLHRDFVNYTSFAERDVEGILTPTLLDSALTRHAYMFESVIAINKGDGTFQMKPLPAEAQFSPIFSFAVDDVNADGIPDVFSNGNFSGVRPNVGQYDANYGTLLVGSSDGHYQAASQNEVGISIKGEVRDSKPITLSDGRKALLVSQNNGQLIILEKKTP